MNVLRTFVAVRIPLLGTLRKVFSDLAEMGRPLKIVRGDDLHVTLKFLGDTDATRTGEIGRIVQEEAGKVSAFEVELVGLGVFPNADRPTVVWAGFRGNGVAALCSLAESLESRLEPLGFPRQRRKFEPHLTLARVKSRPPRELAEMLARHKETHFGTVTIDAVVYYQSELRPDSPHYTPLAVAELNRQG